MAPAIAIAASLRPAGSFADGTAEALRRRNEELERELRRSLEREEKTKEELKRTKLMLRVAEDAEERLSSQMGELEAEALDQAREYHVHIRALMEQLAVAQKLLHAATPLL